LVDILGVDPSFLFPLLLQDGETRHKGSSQSIHMQHARVHANRRSGQTHERKETD
jgi:hypothetical protein